jgi:hypothetical protein
VLELFAVSFALRASDVWPMSAVPLDGLHLVVPQVAVARWVYKAGRTAHANVDLAKEEQSVEASFAKWTVDDFRLADSKLRVFMTAELTGPVHLYQRLGLVRLAFAAPGGPLVRLKSALPEASGSYQRLWDLFAKVVGPARLTIDRPSGDHEDPHTS